MYLTVSKKFEISLSYRYYQPQWSFEKNREVFGKFTTAENGVGGNFNAYFTFHGEVDPSTGMLINVTTIKEHINKLLSERYDHKYLNLDTDPFDKIIPTPENITRQLFLDAAPLFKNYSAELVTVHLQTSPTVSATAYCENRTESQHSFDFVASCKQRMKQYQLTAVSTGEIDPQSGMIVDKKIITTTLDSLKQELDQQNLDSLLGVSSDLELAKILFQKLNKNIPLCRIKLSTSENYFIEYNNNDQSLIGITTSFRAAHRLHSSKLSDKQNLQIYGKCNNQHGHGHNYIVEAVFEIASLDDQYITNLKQDLVQVLSSWDYQHLDLDVVDFNDCPSTGENIINKLWHKIENNLNFSLHRLHLWETPNNRFTLRKSF